MAVSDTFDIAVVGAGPAGLMAAVAFADAGFGTALFGPPTGPPGAKGDPRTTAMFAGGINLLRNIGVWEDGLAASAPLRAIRIIDDTGQLLRAPTVLFRADEIGRGAFGYNLQNGVLNGALCARAESLSNLALIETGGVSELIDCDMAVEIVTQEGNRYRAGLVIGADGKRSICRKSAGIGSRTWDYPQAALVCCLDHSRPHENVSNELHRRAGPLTTVPLPGRRSSLVWVDGRAEIESIKALSDQEFVAALQERLGDMLGRLDKPTPRASFPLSGAVAGSYGRGRIALIGEAAHTVPPIGAQGLNLSTRDIAALFDSVTAARSAPGSGRGRIDVPTVLSRYNANRRGDVWSRTLAVDIVNRSLLSNWLPIQGARGLGLHIINASMSLRKRVMRAGMHPLQEDYCLMRPPDIDEPRSA